MVAKHKKFLTLLLIIILIIGAYFYFGNNPKTEITNPVSNGSSLSSSTGGSFSDSALGNKVTSDVSFLSTLVSLKNMNIDGGLFGDKSFNALKNNAVKLGIATPGRPNPFAPIGGIRYRLVRKKASTGTVDNINNQNNFLPDQGADIVAPLLPWEDIMGEDLAGEFPYEEYFDEEYEIIEDDGGSSNNNNNNTPPGPPVSFISPSYGAIIPSNNIELNFVMANDPVLCWYDLGGLVLDSNVPSTPGDPVDPEYQYPLANCQNKTIILPNGDYVLNLWAKYSNGEYDFESNMFTVKATN